jgi:meso-butanediol dehydrogenase/(S,S)-butanediol dehydrogenase/diacetyl reductase
MNDRKSNVGFSDKVVIVTGATSGIGAACVKEFANCGAKVVLIGRDRNKAEGILSDLRSKGAEGLSVLGDVSDPAFADRAVQETLKKYGRVDVLVNSAGIIPRGDALSLTDEEWLAALAVNVNGTFWMCRASIRAMREKRQGAIVNVASDWGLVGGKGHVAYCTSKGAVVNMTRALALDHIGDGIRVNVVCPGEVRTPMLQSGLERRGFPGDSGMDDMGKLLPIGRVSEPEEQARCIRFLASDDASFVVGAVLSVDGGTTAQ